jgi:serine/threonine protein kinase/Tol biopolymer transport system component
MAPMLTGSRVGDYEIGALLGAGAMGHVYRAHDPRLGRDVAVKVLASEIASDGDGRARLAREARLLAAVNHPNIAAIHDVQTVDGTLAIVMELVEGETLAERLSRAYGRGLRSAEVTQIARQLVDALDAAHEQGIVHRDLKPANIKLTPDGVVKVLDFGLARVTAPAADASDAVTAPIATGEGSIVGTPAYMSPEQVRGRLPDARADIWAFGCVLYELSTGRRPFDGATVTDTLAAVLEREPDLTVLADRMPPVLQRLVTRCLAKDPKARLRAIADARDALDSAEEPQPAVPRATRRRGIAVAVALVALALTIASGAAWMRWRGATDRQPTPSVRFSFATPRSTSATDLALSPDGFRLAFVVASSDGQGTEPAIHTRTLDELESVPLAGSSSGLRPFWSPDGRTIAFGARGALHKVATAGAQPQVICECLASTFLGGTWSDDGTIVFAVAGRGLQSVAAGGGEPQPLTMLDAARGDQLHGWPAFLPGGRRFLYTVVRTPLTESAVYVGSRDGREPVEVLRAASLAVYSPPGYLLFHREESLMAVPFDATTLRTTGEPVRIADGVAVRAGNGNAQAGLTVSASGTLAYRAPDATLPSELVWYDRLGRRTGTIPLPAGAYRGVALSPDDRQVAVHRHDGRGGGVWLWDTSRELLSRLTFGNHDITPLWTADGTTVVFGSYRDEAQPSAYRVPASSGREERIVRHAFPESVTPDGARLLYAHAPGNTLDIFEASMTGEAQPRPLISTPAVDALARISPDGRWLAYMSGQTGSAELYVQPFPDGPRVQITSGGGTFPAWSRGSRELFYVTRDGTMWTVGLRAEGARIIPGKPRALFKTAALFGSHGAGGSAYMPYDVSADGQRFVVIEAATAAQEPPIVVDLNWTSRIGAR